MSETEDTAETEGSNWAHPRAVRIAMIALALYAPQSWYFAMDYAWNDYRLFWLTLFPGLPAFFPVALLTGGNTIPLVLVSWALTAGVGWRVYLMGSRAPRMFAPALVLTLVWSAVSAFGAYGAFRH